MRKVNFNQDYFEVIDTPEKAYWLGFIAADGCLSKTTPDVIRPNRLYLNVTEGDKEHLQKFKDTIQHDGKFIVQSQEKSYSPTPLYYLHCNSVKMCADLMKHGIYPRKTGSSHLPNIDSHLMRHYIRGYFDGDGCISIYMSNDKGSTYKGKQYKCKPYMRCEFSITSDRTILEEMQGILMKECDLPQSKLKEYKRTEKAVSLRYGGKHQIRRIFEYLYKDSTVHMQRKYEKFTLLFS